MTLYPRKAVLAVVAGAALVLSVSAGPMVHAAEGDPATITGVGWWSATPGPAEPEGGFQVTQAASGEETGVAGIKIKVNVSGIETALLVITEGTTKFGELGADIVACRADSNWQAANPGALSDAPTRDCTRFVQLRRSSSLKSWSANVAALLTPPATTLLLVPGPPRNGSIPLPSLEYLPKIPTPVAAPTPIPPPLPPEAVEVLRQLNLPTQADVPIPTGFQVQFASEQLGVLPPNVSSGGGAAPGGGSTDVPSLGSSGTAPFSDLSGGGLGAGAEGTAATVGEAGTQLGSPSGSPLKLASGERRPWGRIWLLAIAALAVGAGSVWARRQTASLGL